MVKDEGRCYYKLSNNKSSLIIQIVDTHGHERKSSIERNNILFTHLVNSKWREKRFYILWTLWFENFYLLPINPLARILKFIPRTVNASQNFFKSFLELSLGTFCFQFHVHVISSQTPTCMNNFGLLFGVIGKKRWRWNEQNMCIWGSYIQKKNISQGNFRVYIAKG